MILKLIAIVLSLGIDTLVVSLSLGMLSNQQKRVRIALVFACAEALMPLVGLFFGRIAGHWLGAWTSFIGGIALLGIGLWTIFHEDVDSIERVEGFALIVTALSISTDELAVGFSLGLIGVPVVLTVVVIAVQAFVFTFIGLTVGRKLHWTVGEWTEKAGGIILAGLAVWILVESTRAFVS